MIEDDKKAALKLAVAGIAVQLTGFVANALTLWLASPRLAAGFSLLITFGAALVVLGCIRLAIAKGYPWFVGLLGLLSVVGVGILWFAVGDRTTPTRS